MHLSNRSRHLPLSAKSPDRVVRVLAKKYTGKADMDLGNPKDTLLGVLMSARTTDVQVLKVFPAFKKKFPTWESLAKAKPSEIAASINTIGLYKSKAKAINGLARLIISKHRGRVPNTMEELMELPGVGRKTANCVLSHVYGADTVCVDTHVFRIARRLGWSRGKTPEAVEEDIQRMLSKNLWSETNRVFVKFGRDICKAPTPQCWRCPVREWCAFEPKTEAPMG
jgi:endonuclease-3